MLIKALKSFVGEVNMAIDEVKEVTNEKLAQALIDAGMAEKAKAKDLKDKLKNKKGKETEELNDVDEDANKPLEEPPKEDEKEELIRLRNNLASQLSRLKKKKITEEQTKNNKR